MILHKDSTTFKDAIEATANFIGTRGILVEKDYWVTKSLKHLALSEIQSSVVFKGGTSLSKAYKLIKRFSEDVDLALIPEKGRSGNATKQKLKQITTIASQDLTEDPEGSNKSSNIRKIYYQYPQILTDNKYGQISRRLLIEANAFAQPFPHSPQPITSYIYEFLVAQNQQARVSQFQLEPFNINVLHLERTFSEKIMNLVKASHQVDRIQELQSKVRHIYDLHQMLATEKIQHHLASDDFFSTLQKVKEDDATARVGDQSWLRAPFCECLLFSDPYACWSDLAPAYNGAFREMVFTSTLPTEEAILTTLSTIQQRLGEYDTQYADQPKLRQATTNRFIPKP